METKKVPPASIMDRIRKCLNLADLNKGATEAEAAAAMHAAKKLMREHNLSMSDVELKQEAEAGAHGVADKRWRKTEDVWEAYLARAVDSLFGTKHYTTKRWEKALKKNMRRVMFVGGSARTPTSLPSPSRSSWTRSTPWPISWGTRGGRGRRTASG